MNRQIALVLVAGVLAVTAAVPVRAHGDHGDWLEHFGWLHELSGACWLGEHPDGRTRETQCFEAQFDRFIRGTVRISRLLAGQWESVFEGDSVFAWDRAGRRITYWHWNDNGGFGSAEARVEGRTIVFPAPGAKGKSAPETRAIWSRPDAESFRVTREEKQGEAWREVLTIVYRRVAR